MGCAGAICWQCGCARRCPDRSVSGPVRYRCYQHVSFPPVSAATLRCRCSSTPVSGAGTGHGTRLRPARERGWRGPHRLARPASLPKDRVSGGTALWVPGAARAVPGLRRCGRNVTAEQAVRCVTAAPACRWRVTSPAEMLSQMGKPWKEIEDFPQLEIFFESFGDSSARL